MVCNGGDKCGVVLFEGSKDVVHGTGEGLEWMSRRDGCEINGVPGVVFCRRVAELGT